MALDEITDVTLRGGEENEVRDGVSYQDVRFVGMDLQEASLRGAEFLDCTFEECDLTLADLRDVAVRDTRFVRCRLQGVDLSRLRNDAMGIAASFEDCDLSLAHASGRDLRACRFEDGHAREAQFTGCDLRGLAFDGIDFTGARFSNCDLREADLRAARGYRIDPATNRVADLRVSLPDALSFLVTLGLRLDG